PSTPRSTFVKTTCGTLSCSSPLHSLRSCCCTHTAHSKRSQPFCWRSAAGLLPCLSSRRDVQPSVETTHECAWPLRRSTQRPTGRPSGSVSVSVQACRADPREPGGADGRHLRDLGVGQDQLCQHRRAPIEESGLGLRLRQ